MIKNLNPFFCLFVFITCAIAGCQKDNQNKVPVADAGLARTIILPKDTVILTGTGRDADGSITGYLWSQVSGPAESEISNSGSPSTVVNFSKFGTYLFQLMVVDNEGATGLDTVSVNIIPPVIDSISLTADPNDGYSDLTYAGNATSNYTDPASPEIDAAAWTMNSNTDILRASFMFNLSKLPQNITIVSAKLNLYSNPTPSNGNLVDANSGSDNSFYIQRVVDSWNMNSGWLDQPSTTTVDQILIPSTNQSRLDLVGVDVTNMVAAMIANTNHGFLIRLANETAFTSRLFCGVRYSDASKHPSLKITFKYNL